MLLPGCCIILPLMLVILLLGNALAIFPPQEKNQSISTHLETELSSITFPTKTSGNGTKLPVSTVPLFLKSLQANNNNNNKKEAGNQHHHHVIALQSTRHFLDQHHRRLRRENRTKEIFSLEEELLQWETYRHLSRFERVYRMEHGLDLELDTWDGFYSNYNYTDMNDNFNDDRNEQTLSSSHFRPNKKGTKNAMIATINKTRISVSRKHHRLLATKQIRTNQRILSAVKKNHHLQHAKPAPSHHSSRSSSSTTRIRSGKFDNYQAIPLSQGYGTHIANIWVGSPKPQRKTVIVDTGSHYTAFPCKGCRNCGRSHHTDPYYDPIKSETYHQLQCDECTGGVICEKGACHFSQAYTEGSSWDAVQVKDRLYCGGSDVLDSIDPSHHKYSIDFMFGCMTKMSGLFLTQLADGIMGLSAHQATLPKQLWDKGLLEHNMFAMCFRRELGTSKRGVSAGSMTIGGVSTNLDTGPIIYAKNMAKAGWFTVYVKNIYIRAGGGQSAKDNSVPPRKTVRVNINPRTVNSGKGVIVDSGTTDTYLSKSAAPAFKKAWKEATGKVYSHSAIKLTEEELRTLPTVLVQCHAHSGGQMDPSVGDYNSFPGYTGDLDTSSPDDLLIAIPATSYMDYSPSTKMYTSRLYFTETAGGVLGSNTMQGHNVVFDWEHSRIGFSESSCSYDKSDVPQVAEDAGYPSDCQVKEPILSKPCVESVDQPLCRFNQSNIALLGTEKWSAVVQSPGTRLGVTCLDAAQNMKVSDKYSDPVVSCDSKGLCFEERPCQLTCQQVKKANNVVMVPEENDRLNCGDSLWSACDRACFQTRIVSAAFSDGKCREISRQTRPCHIHACAREDPCRAPYSVRLVLGLRGVDVSKWSAQIEEQVAASVADVLGHLGQHLNVLPGDVNLRMARSWFLDEDSPDAASHDYTFGDEESHIRTPSGVKAIVDIAVANNRTGHNISSLEDDSDFEDHWKLLGNLSKHFVGQLRESRCYDDDLYVLAQKALAIKATVLKDKKFTLNLIHMLEEAESKEGNRGVFQTSELLNQSMVVAAWSFRNGVDEKVNFLGPRKPWWFGIFRFLHFTTVLVTTSLVLWSLFGVIQNILENGSDCQQRSLSRSPRERDSSTDLSEYEDGELDEGADESIALIVKSRELQRHGSTSPKKRRSNSSRLRESRSF